MNATPDARPDFRETIAWTGGLVDGVTQDQLDLSTPCDDWTVRQLLGHMVAILYRLRAIGEGADPMMTPAMLEGVADDEWSQRFADGVQAWDSVWSDDAIVTTPVRAPFGEMPGGQVIGGYVFEYLVHGWDLARATGQDAEAPVELATRAMGMARVMMPAERRGAGVPFDPPVESSVDAGPTEQLANWLGRTQ